MSGTILLIEDNPQNRYLITFLLEANGYDVVSAADGPTGLRMAVSAPPSVILLDIQLPTMDGYAVARALRGTPEGQRIPIVAVTSYAMPGDRERCLAAGCDGYIEKPIDPDTFVEQIEAFRSVDRSVGGSG
jgi:CheY-like chemotaxis protein